MIRDLVGGLNTLDGWRFTEEAIVQDSIDLSYITSASQEKALSIDLASLERQIPNAIAAYLVLRRLSLLIRRSPLLAKPTPVGQTDRQIWSIPNGGGSFTEWFQHNALRYISSGTIPAGVTVNNVQIGPHGIAPASALNVISNPYVVAVTTNFQADLGVLFDYGRGYLNPIPLSTYTPFGTVNPSQGIDVIFTFGNTSGSAKNLLVNFLGTDDSFDHGTFLLEYQDKTGLRHAIGVYDDAVNPILYQMDNVIPYPILDPGDSDFGSLVFTLIDAYSVINTGYTVEYVMTFALAYLVDV